MLQTHRVRQFILQPFVKRLPRFLRRFRKISGRRIANQAPAAKRQWQRYRHRDWAKTRTAGDELVTPHFIIVGAPKCGTSWLQGVLERHENIVMVPQEIEYFSFHHHFPFDWYCEHFARQLCASVDIKKTPYIVGEKSARYCAMAPENIQRLYRLLPDARLILMIRDPVARHWAHAKKYFAARRLFRDDRAVLRTPRRKLVDFFERMRPLGEFSKIIGNWSAVYPCEQILVLSQEKALSAPKPILQAVHTHLGLSSDYGDEALEFMSRQRNRGPKVDIPDDVAAVLEDMFGSERQWLNAFYADRAFACAQEIEKATATGTSASFTD